MSPIPFLADSVIDAVSQIRSRLGSRAVVLEVRRVPASGFSRVWRRSRFEVIACVPDETKGSEAGSKGIGEVPRLPGWPSPEIVSLKSKRPQSGEVRGRVVGRPIASRFSMPGRRFAEWRCLGLLERMGLTPINADRLLDHLKQENGEDPPDTLLEELQLARAGLSAHWKDSKIGGAGVHLLIGPPGSGKTTVLCKWLTNAVLLESARARVWRLDVPRANSSEALGLHCEILDVPVERSWLEGVARTEEYSFVDVPGVSIGDDSALGELEKLVSKMRVNSLSLVLNAAYDIELLQAQIRTFSTMPLTHLVFTHLDEEHRWGRLWNFVLGTNLPISFLSSGQNIPGELLRATPDGLFSSDLPNWYPFWSEDSLATIMLPVTGK